MERLFCAFAAWILLVGLTGPAKAQYTFTTIDVPGARETFPNGINDAGQIVGYYYGHGFLLDVDGSYTTIDVPGAHGTYAFGINASGQIVGQIISDIWHGLLLDVDGSYTTIDVPGAPGATLPTGISRSRVVRHKTCH